MHDPALPTVDSTCFASCVINADTQCKDTAINKGLTCEHESDHLLIGRGQKSTSSRVFHRARSLERNSFMVEKEVRGEPE